MKICDAAVLVLRESGNPAVMHGDGMLLHMIANRAQARCRSKSWRTERAILQALTRQPGILTAGYVRVEGLVRCFWLPEHTPKPLKPVRTLGKPRPDLCRYPADGCSCCRCCRDCVHSGRHHLQRTT